MCSLYESIKTLCEEKGVTGARMCADIKISRNLLTELKSGRRSGISADKAKKIADYFNVSVDRVLGNEQKKTTAENGDGLSETKRKLIDLIMEMPDDEIDNKKNMIISVLEF